jgi:hypothetical protein
MDADDISRIIFMGPSTAKKIGIVLDAQPRMMIINTLVARNIPGEINLPVNVILKSKNDLKEFSGEETLASLPPFSDPSEILIDNEDQGFVSTKQYTTSPLKKLLGVKNRKENTYMKISSWNPPEFWQRVVLTTYFGKYVRSAVYTKSGTGDKAVTWNTTIKEPGYYDVYCYVGKVADRMTIRSGGGENEDGDQNDNSYKDMHYKIYHDQGIDDVTLDYEHSDGGWNNLGRFYLSADTARVVLTNQSSGRFVIGDAIKWVKQD